MVGETLDTLASVLDPLAGCARRMPANVAIGRRSASASGVRITRYARRSGFALEFGQYVIRFAPFALSRLGKAAAYARHRIEVIGYFLVSCGIEEHGLGFAVYGEHKRPPSFPHVLHQSRGVALERGERVDILRHVN